MIQAFIFDLDGTLVETEQLKAQAYAAVTQELLGLSAPDDRAIDLYESVVGTTDEGVANAMIATLGLAPALAAHAAQDGNEQPWQTLHRLRMQTYQERFGTPEGIRQRMHRHNVDLVREQRAAGRRVAVATSSFTGEARRVLGILGVLDCLDEVVGREQVTHPKPHPEIYLTTMERLGVAPRETVVIEDSPVGVTAAEAAETNWICVANQWTAEPLRQNAAIDQQWVVYDPAGLHTVVEKRIAFASCRPGE